MKITKTKTYFVGPELQSPVKISWMNTVGGWDTMQFTKFHSQDIKTKPNNYFNSQGQQVSSVNSTTTNTYHSTWLTEREYGWLRDLVFSPVLLVQGEKVRVLENDYSFDNIEHLYRIELKVAPIKEPNKIRL